MTNIVKFLNLGRISYEKSNNVQKILSKLHKYDDISVTLENIKTCKQPISNVRTSNILLAMEHNPVYTTGLRDYISQEDQDRLVALGAQFYRTDRGGLVTFHGPGQFNCLSNIESQTYKPSVKWYVCRLEECIIETCKMIGITAERSPHTGVWVGDNKICALGVHVSRGITTHGLALNCNTDLKWFDHIVPCGIEGKGVTSISKQLNKTVTIQDILPVFLKCFENVFNSCVIQTDENLDQILLTNS